MTLRLPFVAGVHADGLDIGGPLAAYGGDDVFVAALDEAKQGAPLWACSPGGAKLDEPRAIGATKSGDVLIAGAFCGPAQFGTSIDGGSAAVFVVELAGGIRGSARADFESMAAVRDRHAGEPAAAT